MTYDPYKDQYQHAQNGGKLGPQGDMSADEHKARAAAQAAAERERQNQK